MESIELEQDERKMPKHKASVATTAITDHPEDDMTSEQTHLQNQMDRAVRLSELVAHRRLDDPQDKPEILRFPIREWRFKVPGMPNEVAINPVVTLIGVVCLWSIVLWCAADRTTALRKLAEWRSYLSLTFTWFFQGSKAVFFFFVLYIWYKYGHIHLGKEEDKPEFSTLTYASMIFTAGAGNGLLVYSVFEPLLNRMHHFYAQAGYRSDDEKDQFAIGITVASWGLAGWAPYSIVAIAMSLAVYRFNLPMCYRSCFLPILGQYTWGWIGDAIDGLTIVFTLAGIFTSLGLVPIHIVTGLLYVGWIDENSTQQQILAIENTAIWLITVISLSVVMQGLHGGVKVLCVVAMGMSCLLMFFVLVLDDTKFLLNLQVQTVGYYLQTSIFQLNFWTDAYGQLREGSGRATDGNSAEQWWMESSLNYIAGWWIAAASLNGQFICSISRGRKIWEVILFSLVTPTTFCLIWFCTWGGIGLRQARQAAELQVLGERYYNNSNHFLAEGSDLCYSVPQDDVWVDGAVVFTNHLTGVTPVCAFDEDSSEEAVFHVLKSFNSGAGTFLLPFFFMLTCVVFYMTGAGSAALFVDKLSSSGRNKDHTAQRMFWIISVGALSTALLTSGGGNALSVVQAAMIVCGLPCAVLIWYLMQTVTLFCDKAEQAGRDTSDYDFPNQPEFSMPVYGGVFNVFEYIASLGKVNELRVEQEMHQATRFQLVECLKGVFVPFVSLHQVLSSAFPQNPKTNVFKSVTFGVCYIGWFGTLVLSYVYPGANAYMWTLFMAKGCLLALVRSDFRAQYNIRSNEMGDFVASMLLWPQVITQMRVQCQLTEAQTPHSPNGESHQQR